MTPDQRLGKINEILALGIIRLCSEKKKNSCVLNLQEFKPSTTTSPKERKGKKNESTFAV